jgi:Secretion system C-terminal sorting domain
VQFGNATVGYAITTFTSDNVLLKTIDGGETWTTINFGGANKITDISCVNENIIYLTYMDQNYIQIFKKSTNGGITFQLINGLQDIEKIQFINEQIGFASSFDNLLKTTDGGNTWLNIGAIPPSVVITPFYFINENVGFKIVNSIYKTTDGGATFNIFNSVGSIPLPLKIYTKTENVVWGISVNCLLNSSSCFSSRIELLNSSTIQIDNCIPLRAIYFESPTLGYALSYNQIYKNTTGILAVNNISQKSFCKIAPNPASSQINIFLNELQLQTTIIEIADGLGKSIFSKTYNFENNITIGTQNFSKGIYFLTITTPESKQTEKLIIN